MSLLLPMNKENKLHSFTAYCLGFVFLLGLKNLPTSYGIYLIVLAFFHFSEYVATGVGNPRNLSWDSFLVNHSVPYWVAMTVSWAEHLAWAWATPSLHVSPLGGAVTRLGLAVCALGEAVRKMAMLQAGRNFNHLVQSQKADDHQLVTSGVYSLCRHPSYVGWFFWSVGTQIVLLNPVCFLLYAYVSFTFFSERIYVEEFTLISFFGQEYRDYQARVGTGIPGISGYEGPPVWGDTRSQD